MIDKDISLYSSAFSTDYTELRIQENRSVNITLLNGDVISNDSSAKSGVSSRTFKDGNWGFSSNPNISDDSVQSVIKSSTDNVKFLNKRHSKGCGIILPESMADYQFDYSSSKDKNNQKYWIEYLKSLDD